VLLPDYRPRLPLIRWGVPRTCYATPILEAGDAKIPGFVDYLACRQINRKSHHSTPTSRAAAVAKPCPGAPIVCADSILSVVVARWNFAEIEIPVSVCDGMKYMLKASFIDYHHVLEP
jgi:hypothetical protein